jgi:hypothetical protein
MSVAVLAKVARLPQCLFEGENYWLSPGFSFLSIFAENVIVHFLDALRRQARESLYKIGQFQFHEFFTPQNRPFNADFLIRLKFLEPHYSPPLILQILIPITFI